MGFAIALIVSLIIIFVSCIILMKKLHKSKNIGNRSTNQYTVEQEKPNNNKQFIIALLDYSKAKNNIYRSSINDILSFKASQNDKRIKVYNKTRYIGSIAIKDYKDFDLIAKYPTYFQGKIISKPDFNNSLKEVTISVQAKISHSKKIYLINPNYLNTLISLNSLFKVKEEIETNYGKATITEIKDDHIIVSVPELGTRTIYDIKNIIK